MKPISVTDKKGHFTGGAVARRRRAGTKIMNPMVREKLSLVIPLRIHPQERMFGAILRTLPKDILKSYNFPFYRDQLRTEMCKRVGLMPLCPFKSEYSTMLEHNHIHASMVLEEARYIISEALYKRWGDNRIPSARDGIELEFLSNEKMNNSEHMVYYFRAKRDLPVELRAQLKPGTIVELMPSGRNTLENLVLANTVRQTLKGVVDSDEAMVDRQLAFMVYNKYGERFEAGVRMVVLDSLLNLTRQFDACTNGNNDLGGEILGRRRKNEHAKPIHIKFQEEQADSDSDDILLVKKEGGKSTSGANRVQVEDVEERHLRESIYRAPPLNSTQVKAARSFLDATDERIILIQGPPGTGKTTLLVSIICRYLLRAHNASQKRRLLVCAPTNKAVTVLATRVLDAIQHDEATSAVLIGDQDRLLSDHRDTLRPIFCYTWRDVMVQDLKKIERELKPDSNNLSALAMHGLQRVQAIRRQVSSLVGDEIQTILTSLHKNFNNLLLQENNKSGTILALRSSISELIPRLQGWDERQVVQTLLADANIIFCTLTSAGAQVVKETVAVDDVICDEAAAATAPELLICTWLLSKRLLLVGDPSQLPATVHSDYGKENGLDQSLQDRLMNNCNFPYTMLDIQYRMKPEIAQWPIQTFYHSGVSNGANVTALHYQTDVTVLNSQPYAWLHVVGDMQRDSSGSCYNVNECEAVVQLLHQLQSRGRRNDWFDVTRIRVITFYQAQVLALQQRLRHKGLSRVTVSTVDSSQGCEANIIILSLVRDGKDGGRVGFLSDVRRLNVALTRAKHQLVCVGNVEGLAQIGNGDHKTTVVGALARDALTRKCVVKFTTSEDFAAMNSRKRAFAEQNQFGKLYNRTDLKRKRRKAKKKAKEAGLPSNS